MNWKVLKKDLKHKKSMNIILLLFIFLATMFIASSINNLRIVMGGTDYFMDQARIKDFLMISMRENVDADDKNERRMETFLEKQKEVEKYSADDSIFAAKQNVELEKAEKIIVNNSIMINCYDISQQKFFDTEDKEITSMEKGTIYLSHRFMKDNKLVKGDRITITSDNGYSKEFVVSGECKDAFLGSDMMGMERFIVGEQDMKELVEESDLPYGKLYSVETKSQEKFVKDFNNQDFNVLFSCERSLVKMSYVMDMVMAAILLLVSVCLILVSVVMLRFIIVFTVNENYKEIGIMKAIGIPDREIRRLYIVKYFALACVGGLLGFIGALPFGNMLVKQVTETLVIPAGMGGIMLQIAVSVLLVVIISGFSYLSTRRIRKMKPMDAIRSGSNGERFHRKGVVRLQSWHFRISSYLALNDVCCEWRKYVVIFLMGIVGIWLLVSPLNTINTLDSEKIAPIFGIQNCDICMVDDAKTTELIVKGKKQTYVEYLDELEKKVEQEGLDVDRTFMELVFRMRVRKDDSSFRSLALQGINTKTTDYIYESGEAPAYENEVALTYITAENIDAHVGDTVYITINDEEKPFVVSAIYQSMNNMGEGIRFHQDAPLDYTSVSGCFSAQMILRENMDAEQLEKAIEKVEKIFPESEVQTVKEFIGSMIGNITDKLESIKVLILVLVIVINVLVIMLMQKMFLIKERGEIGMMKAIGVKVPTIIRWQTKRVGIVLFLGMLLGTLTGTPFSKLTAGQVFEIMGARNIEFVINTWEVYVLYPVIVFVCALAACIVTMRKVKKVSVQEINNIE